MEDFDVTQVHVHEGLQTEPPELNPLVIAAVAGMCVNDGVGPAVHEWFHRRPIMSDSDAGDSLEREAAVRKLAASHRELAEPHALLSGPRGEVAGPR